MKWPEPSVWRPGRFYPAEVEAFAWCRAWISMYTLMTETAAGVTPGMRLAAAPMPIKSGWRTCGVTGRSDLRGSGLGYV